MKVIKKENEFGPVIFLQEERKALVISFGGNLDLYWSLHLKDKDVVPNMVITKENYYLYSLFEQLFQDIKEKKIFEEFGYKDYMLHNYDKLYNPASDEIFWYSDETAYVVANILKIKKLKESFLIEFKTQPHIEGYDYEFHGDKYIPIRFRNSGSRYDPFNIAFMKMYNDLKRIDDINDYGHQLHIEECLFMDKNRRKQIKKR